MDMEKIILGAIGAMGTVGVTLATAYINKNFTNLKTELKNEFTLAFSSLDRNVNEIKKDHSLMKDIILNLEKRLDIAENNSILKMTRKNQMLKIYDQIFREVEDENLKKFARIYTEKYTNTMLKTYEIVYAKKFDEMMFNEMAQNNVSELISLKPLCIEILGSCFSNLYFQQIHSGGVAFLEKVKSIVLRKRNNKVNELHMHCCNYLYVILGDLATLYEEFQNKGEANGNN